VIFFRTSRLKLSLVVLIIQLNGNTPSYSQADTSVTRKSALIIEKLNSVINFDGVPDEQAWMSVHQIKLIMYSPLFGKDPTEDSDIRIAYDDKYLYVGARLYYKNPGMLRSASLKRDYQGAGSDWFGLLLDTFNDKENSMAFFTTPDALRFDANIQRDAVTYFPDQMPMNLSWKVVSI